MKNIIFTVIATIVSFTAIGQVPQYYDSWMFPEVVNQGCVSIPMSASLSNNVSGYFLWPDVTAYAQPYFTDSIISIKGIALLGSWNPNPDTNYKFYFQIRDASLNNILAQVRYDNVPFTLSTTFPWNTSINSFSELLFDSSIFINADKFYAVVTIQEANSAPYYFGTSVYSIVSLPDSCTTTEHPKWYFQSLNKWENIYENNFHYPDALTIFPILDTLAYPQDSLGLSTINSEVEINIYPNPAKNELNVSSSVEITKIEILNIIGQLVYTKELKSKNTKIDISNLNKGNYIAKTYTKKGVKINKFIVH